VSGLGISVKGWALGFVFCVYFVSAKPVAAGILAAKQTHCLNFVAEE